MTIAQSNVRNNGDDYAPVAIRIIVGGRGRTLTADLLHDDDALDELAATCGKSKKPIQVHLDELWRFGPSDRLRILDYLFALPCKMQFHVGEEEPFDDIFEAVLALLADDGDLEKHAATRAAAVEAAAICYPGALEAACGRIGKRLRDLDVKGIRVTQLIRDAATIVKALHKAGRVPSEGLPVRDVLPGAPVGDGLVVPQNWQISDAGIVGLSEGARAAVPVPILIVERHVDVDRDEEYVTLAWPRDGVWKTRTVPRAVISSTRTIVDELAGYGLPVTTNNAKVVVQFLSEFEAANLGHLAPTRVSGHLGWQGDKATDGFLWGKEFLVGESDVASESPNPPSVLFRGSDEGNDQVACGFHSKGSFSTWKTQLAPVSAYRHVRLVFYSAFVSILLRILQSPNFVLDLAGRTTTGKTTALRIAASVWGNPNESDSNSILKTWDTTAVWRERAPAVLKHLPFLLDDTKLARDPRDVATTIYSVVHGMGRGRGSIKGIQRQDTWQTILMTSGEQSATTFTEDGGTRARVVSLWGSPFGGTNQQIAQVVRKLNRAVGANYGHAGPRVVNYLIDHRESWPDCRKQYRELLKEYEKMAADNDIAGRMAPHFAAITVAARISHEALDLPWEYEDPIKPLWHELVQDSREADRSIAALRCSLEWAYQHQDEFFDVFAKEKGQEPRQPLRGWAGRWDRTPPPVPGSAQDGAHKIGFIPRVLGEILKAGGFEVEATVRSWRDKGVLETAQESDGSIRTRIKTRVGAKNAPPIGLVVIRGAAIEQVMG